MRRLFAGYIEIMYQRHWITNVHYYEAIVNFAKYFRTRIIVGLQCKEKKDERYNTMAFISASIFFDFCDCLFSFSLIIMECKIDRLNQIIRNEVYLESRIVNHHFTNDFISHLKSIEYNLYVLRT